MPINIDIVFRHFQERRPDCNQERFETPDLEQAERVAWRQILRWVEAQFALINTGMVKADEVFMPYLLSKDGYSTLYQIIVQKGGFQKALPMLRKD